MKKVSGFIFIIIGLVLFLAVGVFATTLTHALVSPTDETEVSNTKQDEQYIKAATSTLPSRIQIPSIGVDAHVQHVGLSKHGTMAVPTNFTDVGWYKYGAIPGHTGTAVIDGHLDNGFGKDAVFKNLNALNNGDEIIIIDHSGKKLVFSVYQKDTFTPSTPDTSAIFANKGKPLLNLITCEGTWDPAKKSYDERRVIFAELIRVEE
jgi:sortase A